PFKEKPYMCFVLLNFICFKFVLLPQFFQLDTYSNFLMMDNKMEEFARKLEKVMESAYRKLDKRTDELIERYKKMFREEMAEILSGHRIEAKPPSGESPQDVSKTGVSESSVVKPRCDGDMTEQ